MASLALTLCKGLKTDTFGVNATSMRWPQRTAAPTVPGPVETS